MTTYSAEERITKEVVCGMSKGYSWMVTEGYTGFAFQKNGEKYNISEFYNNCWEYKGTFDIDNEDDYELLYVTTMFNVYLLCGYNMNGSLYKKSTTTIAGRSCDKYTNEVNAILRGEILFLF